MLEDEPFIIASEQSMPQLSASHDYSDLYDPDVGPDQVHHRAIPGFLIGREIGDGGFGAVRIGCFLSTNERIAVKVVDKKRLEDPDDDMLLKREIRAMKHVNGHPGIIKLHGSFETDSYVYLVMDYLKGGTLLDYVKKKKNLPKTDAARLLSQAAEALKHCHGLALIHRDIKLENMMLDENNNLKLIDFGLCAFFQPGKKLRVYCGSPSYAAPEIIGEREYEGPPVDVWSLGVCFYAMLCGYLPFYNSKGSHDMEEKILAGRFSRFPEHILKSSVKTLLEGMLAVDPAQRFTLDEVLEHRWIKAYRPAV